MIKNTFIFTVFLFYVLSPSALSADEGDISVGGIFGGVGLRGMDAYGSNGFGFGGYFSYAPSDLFDLDLNFIYSPHSKGSNKANSFYGTIGLKSGMMYDQLYPFITAGLGVYRNSIETVAGSDAAASFGFHFGGGMDVKLSSRFTIGLLARYHSVLRKDINSTRAVDDMWDVLLRVGFVFGTGLQGGWD